jgi:serralysin
VGNNFYLDSISSGSGPELKFAGVAVVAGEYGDWAPIGAEQTLSGYEIAWKFGGADQYIIWTTDSTGNFTSNAIGAVSGNSNALESFETSFHQDLNGDGVIGVPSPTSPLTSDSAGANSAAFSGTSLTLNTPSTFNGQIIGFTGDGTLAGSDQIDLRGMNYATVHSNYDSATGILDVNDGTKTADLQFLGNYSQDNFKFADNGSGGTIVYPSPVSSQSIHPDGTVDGAAGASQANLPVTTGQDSFVFAPHFGQVTIAHFKPETDTIQISRTVFADMDALLGAIHDDTRGNAVITDAEHDAITLQHITTAQLYAHQNDFHIV